MLYPPKKPTQANFPPFPLKSNLITHVSTYLRRSLLWILRLECAYTYSKYQYCITRTITDKYQKQHSSKNEANAEKLREPSRQLSITPCKRQMRPLSISSADAYSTAQEINHPLYSETKANRESRCSTININTPIMMVDIYSNYVKTRIIQYCV